VERKIELLVKKADGTMAAEPFPESES